MIKINLYKNDVLELCENGKREENYYIYKNIRYYPNEQILIKTNHDDRIVINFIKKELVLYLNDVEDTLIIPLEIYSKTLSDTAHEITYIVCDNTSEIIKLYISFI